MPDDIGTFDSPAEVPKDDDLSLEEMETNEEPNHPIPQ